MYSLIAVALSCQMTQMMPDYYTAELIGPNSSGKYSLTLTYKFYGIETDYKYNLISQGNRLIGTDKRKDSLAVDNLVEYPSGLISLVLSSNKEGRIAMTCQNKKITAYP